MKRVKIRYSCLSGIIFIIINVVAKFLIYGNDTIWMNYMPPLPEGTSSPGSEILKNTTYKLIPFIIINICAIAIYTRMMYTKKIYNKKTDIIFSIIILFIVLILLYFWISAQYRVCV